MKATKKSVKSAKSQDLAAARQTLGDFRDATLIVSVVLNLFVLITWLVAKSSTDFSDQLSRLFV